MARYCESLCRLCRREGAKLFLKGDRCYTDRCAIDRRGYPPGQHGQGRTKFSDYGHQLREKQKIRRIYGLLEAQFRRYFREARRSKGNTGSALLILLERRLDNVVYRMGFGSSRNEARQLVRHGHILVNGKRINLPSYLVKVGESVSVDEASRQITRVNFSLDAVERRGVPAWLELDRKAFQGLVRSMPAREDLTMPMQEQLVVELYSK
ncbi:MAG TPA: 30S ribosomal protein S4 [Bdellovibrionota bacterium]|nr:30S ribosomal protein S4 [Bdellovibrionota bacterium]